MLQSLLAYLLAACGENREAVIATREIEERFSIPIIVASGTRITMKLNMTPAMPGQLVDDAFGRILPAGMAHMVVTDDDADRKHDEGCDQQPDAAVNGAARHAMAGIGLGRTFQNVALFNTMTVRDNLLVGAHHRGTTGFLANCGTLGALGGMR